MTTINKIKYWADSFESKTAKILAFWGVVTGLVALFPTIIAFIMWFYNTSVVVMNASKLVEDVEEINEYQNFMIMQLSSALHEELDTKKVYGISLEESNGGDLWYFDTITVYGVVRPIIYSANLKRKGKRIYIQDIKGSNRWVKK